MSLNIEELLLLTKFMSLNIEELLLLTKFMSLQHRGIITPHQVHEPPA